MVSFPQEKGRKKRAIFPQ